MFVPVRSVLILYLSSIVYSKFEIQEALSNKTSREGRFLGLFTIVQFRDDNCDGRVGARNVRGRCLSAENCGAVREESSGRMVGRGTGSCAQGFGVCCVHELDIQLPDAACTPLPGHDRPTGGDCPDVNRRQLSTVEIKEKIIYLQNPSFPLSDENGGDVTLTLVPRDEDVVQYRLDFITFEMDPGSFMDSPTRKDAVSSESCDRHQMTISSVDMHDSSVNIGNLCGVNSGQHLYIHLHHGRDTFSGRSGGSERMQAGPVMIRFRFDGAHKYKFNIMVTQLDKSRDQDWKGLAPEGCQQFFTEPSANIASFNFNREDPMKSRYQPNLNYKICIRPNDKSQIQFELEKDEDMSIGSMMKAHAHTRMRFNSSEYEDETMGHMNPCGEAYCGPICTAMPHTHAETDVMMKEGMGDYLEIPGAFFQREDGITHTDHYCGNTGLGFSSGFAHQPRGLFSLLGGGGRQIEEHRPLRTTTPGLVTLAFKTDDRDDMVAEAGEVPYHEDENHEYVIDVFRKAMGMAQEDNSVDEKAETKDYGYEENLLVKLIRRAMYMAPREEAPGRSYERGFNIKYRAV